MTGAQLEIDLSDFRSNVAHLAATAAPARTMLAVKANAYGHGILPLARAALDAGAESLAVLDVPAAQLLRREGIGAPLFAWLHGTQTDFGAAIDQEIDLGISAVWQLDAIAASGRARPARVHLKVDTGLHRNGARAEDWPVLVKTALDLERRSVVRIAALWSHLADSSPDDDAAALARFHDAVEVARSLGARPEYLHLAASSAGIREPEARLDLVRFGIAAYGISPFDDATAHDLGLRAVMTLRAPIRAIDERGAVVAVGSGDGVQPRPARDAYVASRGHRLGVREVTVDSMIVEPHPTLIEGDSVTVFGPGIDGEASAEQWAAWAGTIGDEIVARMSPRLARVYRE